MAVHEGFGNFGRRDQVETLQAPEIWCRPSSSHRHWSDGMPERFVVFCGQILRAEDQVDEALIDRLSSSILSPLSSGQTPLHQWLHFPSRAGTLFRVCLRSAVCFCLS